MEVPGSGVADFVLPPRELVLLKVAPRHGPQGSHAASRSRAPTATPAPTRKPTRAPAPEPTARDAYDETLAITEDMYTKCDHLDAPLSEAETYDAVVDALEGSCGDCCAESDCDVVCEGFSCEAFSFATCALVRTRYGCECAGCQCGADYGYGYGNFTNSTSSNSSSGAKPDVVALTIFSLMAAFFIYCVHKYLKSQREEREYQKRKAAKKEMLAKQIAHVELEIVDNDANYLEKGEADDEIRI